MKRFLFFILLAFLFLSVNAQIGRYPFPRIVDSTALILGDGNTVGWYIADADYITTDGQDSVTVWSDASGTGYDLEYTSLGGSDSKPVFKGDSVTFNGTTGVLLSVLGTQLDMPCIMYFVINQVAWTDEDRIIAGTASTTYIKQNSASPKVQMYAGTAGTTVDATPIGVRAIMICVFNDDNSTLEVNGVNNFTGDTGPGDWDRFYLGAANATASCSSISIMELIIRQGVEDADTKTYLYNYLKDKYGL